MHKQIERNQIARVHILKKEVGLSDDDYRALLEGWNAVSSKDLTFGEANELIRTLEGLVPRKQRGGKKYDELGKRKGMASPPQLRMLEAMWAEVSVFEDPHRRHEAFCRFLYNRFGRMKPDNIEEELVGKIKRTLEGMREWKRRKSADEFHQEYCGEPYEEKSEQERT